MFQCKTNANTDFSVNDHTILRKTNAQKILRVIGYDTVPHQMYQPALPKVHKQKK